MTINAFDPNYKKWDAILGTDTPTDLEKKGLEIKKRIDGKIVNKKGIVTTVKGKTTITWKN